MSASKNLGKVFMTPKGIWDKTLNYTKLDIVTNKVGKISCGYIATTDIEKNVEITDNRWLKLFELLDGDLTEEYKAVQTDVTNKATDVDTNKKAVDLIYSQMQKLYDVEISTTTPTNERTGLWINPDDISSVINIPEIKDNEVSDVDTWSSKKIDNVTNSLKEDISNKITKFYASSQGETHITDSDNGKIQDMMIYGKSSQDGTPSPENPVEIKRVVNPTIKICGKNLFDSKKFPIILNRGIDTNTGNIYQSMSGKYCATEKYIPFPYSGKKISFNASMSLCAYDQDYKFISSVNKNNGRVPSGTMYVRFDIKTEDKDKVQIELSENTTTYEPYKEQTIQLLVTLNAIPVSSDGNVTINGQQYITDYVDVERGKLVKMVDSSKLDNTQSIINKTEWLLAEPQEIDLTQEEVQTLKTLATYYPTTNISVNSEQLDGYTVFNYPISMENGWNYVKQQIGDTRDYIYDMDLQSAEAYVNSEYAVALTELEV